MDDFRLKVFIAAARTLSFTRAAEQLYISQPAVSKHIGELESRYKVQLFARRGSRLELTDAGRTMLEAAERLADDYRRLEYEMSLCASLTEGELRLGASTTIAQYLLPPILARFTTRFPGVRVAMMSGNSDQVEQARRGRVDASVVGRRADDQRVVAEHVAQHDRFVGERKVVHDDRADAPARKLAGDAFGHLLRVAVHRTVGEHYAGFSLVAAQTVVNIHYLRNLPLPYGTVGRTDGRGVQSADLCQRFLHGAAVFAHDAGVVAAHLVPVARRVELRIGDAAVDSPERAESVAREERPGFGAPRDHRFGPVYHRRHVERERLRAERNRVALLDFERPGVDAVEALDHLQRLGIADDLDVGIDAAQRCDRRRVVGFHVVDDQIIDLPFADGLADVGFEAAAEGLFDGVDQGDLFACDQIGVVRHAHRKRPEGFEARGGAVIDPDVVDAGKYFGNCHKPFLFCFGTNLQKIFFRRYCRLFYCSGKLHAGVRKSPVRGAAFARKQNAATR